mmetsp:Transcript_119753/g.310542  ORF Transcript_119753/g.310542 Transcript_119753/m.310542 type:complete len:346 (-) Transcript_119753:107-1144(-)
MAVDVPGMSPHRCLTPPDGESLSPFIQRAALAGRGRGSMHRKQPLQDSSSCLDLSQKAELEGDESPAPPRVAARSLGRGARGTPHHVGRPQTFFFDASAPAPAGGHKVQGNSTAIAEGAASPTSSRIAWGGVVRRTTSKSSFADGESPAHGLRRTAGGLGRRCTLPEQLRNSSDDSAVPLAGSGSLRLRAAALRRPATCDLSPHVHFSGKNEVFKDFTPYSNVYGMHPGSFFLDGTGHMVCERERTESSLEDVDSGDIVQCVAPCGVGYRSQPKRSAHVRDFRTIAEGDQTKVLDRRGEWIRDVHGWLPLFMNGTPLFANAGVPENLVDLGLPRRGALTVRPDSR